MAENPCPYYADGHHMKAGLLPRVIDEDGNRVTEFDGGGFYQCTGCKEYMIASGFPHFGWPIGYYVTQGGILFVGIQNGISVAKIQKNYIHYTEDATITGYKFVGYN